MVNHQVEGEPEYTHLDDMCTDSAENANDHSNAMLHLQSWYKDPEHSQHLIVNYYGDSDQRTDYEYRDQYIGNNSRLSARLASPEL
jgi:hypothetical protein